MKVTDVKEIRKRSKQQSGITLVALVVTVVVLLILAGVSIRLVLDNNGIIKKSEEAKDKYTQGKANDQTDIDFAEDYIEQMTGENSDGGIKTKTLTEAKEDSMVNSIEKSKVKFSDGTVIIPEKFKIANDSANNVAGGVVIEDKDGNQFVWIPVDSVVDYKRVAYSSNTATGTIDTDTNSEKIKWYSSAPSSCYYIEKMPEDEKESIEKYHGYYIGRYEAGDKESTEAEEPAMRTNESSTTNTVTVKKGQVPYEYVRKSNAVSLAKNMKENQGYIATTKLCSSYAWDTAIEFIQKTNKNYGNSSEEDNYEDTEFSYTDINGEKKTKALNSKVLVPTGQTTPVCNIYDMGGNLMEWTTERCKGGRDLVTVRGGWYGLDYSDFPAGARNDGSADDYGGCGFRITLFM